MAPRNAVLESAVAERDRVNDAIDEVLAAVEADDRDPTDAERDVIRRHRERLDNLEPVIVELGELEQRRDNARDVRGVLARARATSGREVEVLPAPAEGETVYRTFAEYARDELICRFDAIAAIAGPGARAGAQGRLERVVANTTTTQVAGLLPPQYMNQIMQVIATDRPIVESARRIGLNAGTLMYPSITQRPIVGKQTAEKTELPSQAMTVAFVTVTADTYGGAGDLSWQAIQWSNPDALVLWFDLAASEYARQTEAATGTVLAALTAGPVVPATPTINDWFTAITTAAGTVYTNSHRRADTIYADIATGYSIIGLVSQQVPLFLPTGGFSLSSGAGNIAGLNLVISPGLPAKTVIVGVAQQLLAAETPGAPVQLRAVEPSIAGMQVGIIGAFVAKVVETGAFVKLSIT